MIIGSQCNTDTKISGFQMITWEQKVRLKLCVVYKCILWISKSSLMVTNFRNSYQNFAPFCTSNLLSFWFPNDYLWAKSQMCGMPFWHFLLKLLQHNFNIGTYKVTLASEDLWPTAFYILKETNLLRKSVLGIRSITYSRSSMF